MTASLLGSASCELDSNLGNGIHLCHAKHFTMLPLNAGTGDTAVNTGQPQPSTGHKLGKSSTGG